MVLLGRQPLIRLTVDKLAEAGFDQIIITTNFMAGVIDRYFQRMKLNTQVLCVEEKLLDRTEGWIVGLKMASLSLQGIEDASIYIDNFNGSNRYILDYLTDEVLKRQEDKVESFLLSTSILERLNRELCDTITGRADGQDMLELLEDGNLFLIPLDDERKWYRYHHLFSELLRNSLYILLVGDKASEVSPVLLTLEHDEGFIGLPSFGYPYC